MKEAIQKAIEGGWKPKHFPLTEEPIDQMGVFIAEPTDDDDNPYTIRFFNTEYPEEGYNYSTNIEMIILDPLFWQGLGKALGWEEYRGCPVCHKVGSKYVNKALNPKYESKYFQGWQYEWHRFIDHLAEGKDAESFFASLINSKKQ